jgi:hypothetical protein
MMQAIATRVAQRYLRATSPEGVFEDLADTWVDAFIDALPNVSVSEDEVERVLERDGLTADKLNEMTGAPVKTASAYEWVAALGGFILKRVWKTIAHPFVSLEAFIRSPEFRADVKRAFKRALSHEVRSTKHMMEVAERLAKGDEVKPQEVKAARAQVIDILSKAVLIYVVGPHLAQLFAHGVMKALLAILSPLDELAAILLDKPLRIATKKMLDTETGLLPSGFYTHF